MIKQNTPIQVNEVVTDDTGRYVILKCSIGSEKYILANIYAPNEDDPHFFDELFKAIDKFNIDQKIIGGDFNLVLNLDMDKQSGNPVTRSDALNMIKAYIAQNDLILVA